MEPGESEDDETYWSELGGLEGATTIAGGLEKDAKGVATSRHNTLHHAVTKVVGQRPCSTYLDARLIVQLFRRKWLYSVFSCKA